MNHNGSGLLNQLPKTPNNKKGWPWDEESDALPPKMPDGEEWPTITIITPSFKQGKYLEEAIRSVLLQNYPNLEYFVLDGGSKDNSVEIIKKYEPWIDWWVSEPDGGQSNAINKGFSKATGLYLNWINSDDLLAKDALKNLALNMDHSNDKAVYLGDYYEYFDGKNKMKRKSSDIRTLEKLVDIKDGWRGNGGNQIGQQATFFPNKLFKEVGGVNAQSYYTMDYELWGKFLIAGATFKPIHRVLGIFRIIEGQKTSERYTQTLNLIDTAKSLVKESKMSKEQKKKAFKKIRNYKISFIHGQLRSKIGIKRRLGIK